MNVIMRSFLAFFSTVVILTLSACDNFSVVPIVDITANFQPSVLGFEVNNNGTIVITSHVLTFVARPGSIGARIDGYDVEYLDPAGNVILPGDGTLFSSGSLGVIVPPGLACPTDGDPIVDCNINTPGVVWASSSSEPVSNFFTLPGNVAIEVLRQNYTGARAIFHFRATTDLNQEIEIDTEPVAIAFPVKGG